MGGGVLTVSSVDTIVLSDGISRRRLILEDMNQWNNDSITWIEGIGDIGLGPFYAHLFYWTDSWAQLLCTYQEETLIFQNPEADSCFATITTSIEELDSNSSIKVYPNPVNDLLTLDLSQINQSFTEINIFNALGELVYQNNKPTAITEINTRELQAGIYFLLLKDKSGMSYSQRIIKR